MEKLLHYSQQASLFSVQLFPNTLLWTLTAQVIAICCCQQSSLKLRTAAVSTVAQTLAGLGHVTVLVTEGEVGRLGIHLQDVVVVAQVAEALPHVDGLVLLAEVDLEGVDVVDQVSVADSLEVGLVVLSLDEDVVAVDPAHPFPRLGHGLALPGEGLEEISRKNQAMSSPYKFNSKILM